MSFGGKAGFRWNRSFRALLAPDRSGYFGELDQTRGVDGGKGGMQIKESSSAQKCNW